MSQNGKILSYLKTGNSLTPKTALKLWGCFRLAARINDLRGEGHEISTEIVKRGGKRFAKYTLQ